MVVKTYRGLLADGGQEKIPLSTKDGGVGYRIVKFQIFAQHPGTLNYENVVKIFKTTQSSITDDVDFSDNDLLAVAYLEGRSLSASGHAENNNVIFDQEIFNQDIFVTQKDADVGTNCNYYIELEQMKLDHTQNMSATLKAIRGSAD